jgi:NRAMP (natural resistance-associated macrophage protein)-like metal ion transporter
MSENKNQAAVLDSAHVGDIRGAFGTIRHNDTAARKGWFARFKTLLAILGPGLIVMVGDNDAGAFSTYGQAGQNYGTTLLWTMALLIPVLYISQEMVLRLGAVTGVGHARLILERFGKFWGAFSAIDLLLLNALTIVTEFIGISLGMNFLGVPRILGVGLAAIFIMLSASTGDFRRFERFSLILVFGSLLLIPILVMVHPPMTQVLHDFVTPQMPLGAKMSDVMLLVIGIVGTTVAPWQLFFQQSYIIDKRITPRFIKYERADLWLGIILVIVGAVAMIAFTARIFAGHPEFGHFQDAGAICSGFAKYYGRLPGILFAVALIDAAIIGAMAVSLSTAYALGDVLSLKHSLHRKPTDAPGFYAMYCGLIVVAAALVLIPGVPLGLLTNAVQTLAGILLPSAVVFLLILCNDKQVLGPWVNNRLTNMLAALIVAVLVVLSIILTSAVAFPGISGDTITGILVSGCLIGLIIAIAVNVLHAREEAEKAPRRHQSERAPSLKALYDFRMPPLEQLKPMLLSQRNKLWMAVLRIYLLVAMLMVVYSVIKAMW